MKRRREITFEGQPDIYVETDSSTESMKILRGSTEVGVVGPHDVRLLVYAVVAGWKELQEAAKQANEGNTEEAPKGFTGS